MNPLFSSCVLLISCLVNGFQQAQADAITRGACYSAMHNSEYSSKGHAFSKGLDTAMDTDFEQIAKYFTHARTFYSSFSGYPVAPWAAKHGVKLYLGVYMTNETWFAGQVSAAVDAVTNYPDTIEAILIGNENLYPNGEFTANQIVYNVTRLKTLIKEATGRDVKVGTVQRVTEWMNSSISSETAKLAAACDVIGVNIYPFYSSTYNASNPMKLLNSQWQKMVTAYGADKVRLTETGFPTGGSDLPTSGIVPSLDGAVNYYNAFVRWTPTQGQGPMFWYSFYNRRSDDSSVTQDYKRNFGFFTATRGAKAGNFPSVRL